MDEDLMQELVNQYLETFTQLAIVPIKITFTDFTNVITDPFEQTTIGTPVEKTLYKKCAFKIGKKIGEDDSSILLSSIPAGKYGVYFNFSDRILIADMNEKTKKTLKFTLYYNSESPIKLNPEEQVSQIQYFLNNENYPVHQLFVCGVEK